jgi:hypothetical protein
MNYDPPTAAAWKRLVEYAEKHAIGPVRIIVDSHYSTYSVAITYGPLDGQWIISDGPTITEAIDAFFHDVETTEGAPK